jgi:hypothetical protein
MTRQNQDNSSDAQGDIHHPVVTTARTVARRGRDVGSSETYVIDEEGRAEIERCLLDHAEDPTLPRGVIALFDLATALHLDHDADGAAAAILAALGKVGPQLKALGSLADMIPDLDSTEAQAVCARSIHGRSPRHTAPEYDAPSPAGTISIGAFTGSVKRRW